MSISEEIHLLALSDRHTSFEASDGSDSDGDVEMASNFDTEENDLVGISTNFRIDWSEESVTNNGDPSCYSLIDQKVSLVVISILRHRSCVLSSEEKMGNQSFRSKAIINASTISVRHIGGGFTEILLRRVSK